MRKMAKALMVISIVVLVGGVSFAKDRSSGGTFRFDLKLGDFRISNLGRLAMPAHPRVREQYVFDDDWDTHCRINGRQGYRRHKWQDCSCPFCSNYRDHHGKQNSKKARIDRYIRQLRHSNNDDVREKAADKLGDLKARRGVDVLTRALFHDPEDDVRQQAARSLGQIGLRQSIKPLRRAMLHDDSRKVRREAKKSLEKITSRNYRENYRDHGRRHDN